jgi:hypothetical protein
MSNVFSEYLMVQPRCKWESDSQIAGGIIFFGSAQRQGSAGPWHKVFAGWRRSKYFMSWSRMYPIVGQLFHCLAALYCGRWAEHASSLWAV